MGGSGGHMWHPFDCPDVNSGLELIEFFKKSVQSLKEEGCALKIDGVNLSFRLVQNPSLSPPYEFVVDRSSMKQLDVDGVTATNASQRWSPDPKTGEPHGMVEATNILLGIFNNALPEIMPELEQLELTSPYNPDTGTGGHYGLYLNTEFVRDGINVKKYPFDFIAVHGLKKFVPKGPNSRHGVDTRQELIDQWKELEKKGGDPTEIQNLKDQIRAGKNSDQKILNVIRDKVEKFANEQDFKLFTRIPASVKRDISLEDALNKQFLVLYTSEMRDEEEPSELGMGEGNQQSIKQWLEAVSESPLGKKVIISDYMMSKFPRMGEVQDAMAKNFYIAIGGKGKNKIPVNKIIAKKRQDSKTKEWFDRPQKDIEHDIEAIVDAAVVWHATRIMGNAVLDAMDSEDFGPVNEQEGCVVDDPNICGGTPFKITGNFILDGVDGPFGDLNEEKYRKGKLLKEFTYEDTQKTKGGAKYVILIPGGFKPPTVGHFSMIQQYDKNPDVIKIFVVVGFKPREGVTHEQSMRIFDVYGGFSDKVEFKNADGYPTPMTACYEFMKDSEFTGKFPNSAWSLGASDKGKDKDRIDNFKKYFNEDNPGLVDVKVIAVDAARAYEVGGEAASASRMRKAIIDKNHEEFLSLLPNKSVYNNVLNILNIDDGEWQASGERKLDENFLSLDSLFSLVEEVSSSKKRINDKTQFLIDKEEKDPKQAYAIASSMDDRGELTEEDGDLLKIWGPHLDALDKKGTKVSGPSPLERFVEPLKGADFKFTKGGAYIKSPNIYKHIFPSSLEEEQLSEADEANLRDLLGGYLEGLKNINLPGWLHMDEEEKEKLIGNIADTFTGEIQKAEAEKTKETEAEAEKAKETEAEKVAMAAEPTPEEDKLEEVSAMAGGAVEGGAAGVAKNQGPWGKLKKRDYYV